MATKGKPTAPTTTLSKDQESALTKALAALGGGKAEEAAKAFRALVEQAAAEGHVGLERVSRGYLAAAESRLKKATKAAGDPVLELSVLLNDGESELALEQADKAIKGHPAQASLHYLKATALAQMGRFEEAAECLAAARNLNDDFQWVYRLEPDFSRARSSGAFVRLEPRD